MNIPIKYTLRKYEIIRRDRDIQDLFRKGKKIHGEFITIYYLLKNITDKTRLKVFFHVRKKEIKKSVIRNRMKRILREVHRLQKHEWLIKIPEEQCLYLAISLKKNVEVGFEDVKKDYIHLLNSISFI